MFSPEDYNVSSSEIVFREAQLILNLHLEQFKMNHLNKNKVFKDHQRVLLLN